ncbi:MAG: hypothetical protein VKM17_01170 [Cyanobacteriota bacterium]|nr:hypothetical protein [Cyanobacteriota bacterium]
MLTIHPDTTIYVLCPAHIVTGGIEAVHQLVDKLRKFGHNAQIATLPRVANPMLLQYRNYEVVFADAIEDSSRNILIATEVNPGELNSYSAIQKCVWWLSVDNHENNRDKFDFHGPASASVSHFAQSAYARRFLQDKGVKSIHNLSDYLHAEYLRHLTPPKNDVILYTPVKGSDDLLRPLIEADSSLQWLPLKGMIRKQHAATLRRGKVYVDFGSHPGKDRQPREAAVNGCCVVVGLRGSATFQDDVPIPEPYKFDCRELQSGVVLSTIRDCLAHHGQRQHHFQSYAESIRGEEQRFEEEVKRIFGVQRERNERRFTTATRNTLTYIQQNSPFSAMRGLANELVPLGPTNLARRVYRQLAGRQGS